MDSLYKQQLEKFGIEESRVVPTHIQKKINLESENAAKNSIRILMGNESGRRYIYNLLDTFRVFTSPFSPKRSDVTSFLCGLQAAGHLIQNDVMKYSPELYYTMVQEAVAAKIIPEEDEAY